MRKNKKKLSIIIPTIRTHLLEDLYQSIVNSCNQHSFEVIFVGPFDIPQSLLEKKNVIYVKDYGQPSRAAQIGLINATGQSTCWITDDCFCYPNMLSKTLDLYEQLCSIKDIVGMRFFENPEHYAKIKSGETKEQNPIGRFQNHPDSYWYAQIPYGHYPGVESHWGIACLFLANTKLIEDFGGWDCQWEHLNHSTHDLLFRLQQSNSQFYLTSYDVFVANWYEGISKDHAPVHYGQKTHDEQLFKQIWFNKNKRDIIDINNWKNVSNIWERRFCANCKAEKHVDLYDSCKVGRYVDLYDT